MKNKLKPFLILLVLAAVLAAAALLYPRLAERYAPEGGFSDGPTAVIGKLPDAAEEPTAEATAEPTTEPTTEPTAEPTAEPTTEPTAEPTAEPTEEAPAEAAGKPAAEPEEPTDEAASGPAAPMAPDFTVYTEMGAPVSLSDFAGTPVILNLWATWCGPCRGELPAFEALAKEYEGRIAFVMVSVDQGADAAKTVKDFLKENGYSFSAYLDTRFSAASAYSASSIPVTALITADGRLVGYRVGAVTEAMLRNAAEELLGGKL